MMCSEKSEVLGQTTFSETNPVTTRIPSFFSFSVPFSVCQRRVSTGYSEDECTPTNTFRAPTRTQDDSSLHKLGLHPHGVDPFVFKLDGVRIREEWGATSTPRVWVRNPFRVHGDTRDEAEVRIVWVSRFERLDGIIRENGLTVWVV